MEKHKFELSFMGQVVMFTLAILLGMAFGHLMAVAHDWVLH